MATTTETPLRVLVWGENRHEQLEPEVAERYPDGMHNTIREGIEEHLGAPIRFSHRATASASC